MAKWAVRDRWGNEIYLTEERWQHILERHEELVGLIDEVLETLRRGRRRQETLDPNRYRYRRPCAMLPPEFNHNRGSRCVSLSRAARWHLVFQQFRHFCLGR